MGRSAHVLVYLLHSVNDQWVPRKRTDFSSNAATDLEGVAIESYQQTAFPAVEKQFFLEWRSGQLTTMIARGMISVWQVSNCPLPPEATVQVLWRAWWGFITTQLLVLRGLVPASLLPPLSPSPSASCCWGTLSQWVALLDK